jgi:GNAT superfamily N-acetyltransferase
MLASTDDIRAIERLHVRAWPAIETAAVCGSKRANSVSTVQFSGDDPVAALDDVEARYRARGAPMLIQTYDLTAPHGLTGLLPARGYGESEATATLVKAVTARGLPADVEIAGGADAAWRELYLGSITENRRATNAKILDAIPRPCAWFSCRRDGRVISTGLCVADGDLAVVECMATCAEARRQGGAQAVLVGIEAWAAMRGVRALALQAVAGNLPAVALYRGSGFAPVATNRFWVKN